MSTEDLVRKIRRMHAAVNSATELDIKKFPPKFLTENGRTHMRQDFNAGLSEEELHNLAFQIVRSISDLKDYLRAWAKQNGKNPQEVEDTINNSLPLSLIVDLANIDKHFGTPKVKEQRSKKSPKLIDIRRVLQTTAKGLPPGSMFGMRFTPQGAVPFGGGKTSVVISGSIVDGNGGVVMEFQFAQDGAIEAWEKLYEKWSINIRNR